MISLPFAQRARVMAASLFAAAALLPAQAWAHRTWLVPSATVVSGKEPVVMVDAAVSEDLFEYDTNALPLEGLAIIAPDGSKLAPESRSTSRRRSSFDLKLIQPGTYRIVNSAESVLASYKVAGETKRWRGSPEAFAKEVPQQAEDLQVTRMVSRVETYVTHDRPNDKAFAPLGFGLEVIPQTPPTDLSVGDTSVFVLLLDGQPAANADVTVLRGGNRYRYKMGEIALKTDAEGRFSVKWPEAGRYWIGASHGGRGSEAGGAPAKQPARRATVSATVEVLPQ